MEFLRPTGQNVGLGVTNVSLSPSNSTYVQLALYNPNGNLLSYGNCYLNTTGCGLDLLNLASGTYTIVAAPQNGGTANFTATLSSEVTGALTIGTATPVNVSRPGQNARFTFSGTQGQQLGLTLSNLVLTGNTANVQLGYYVYKPDGSLLIGSTALSGTAILDLPALPATGTYTIYFALPYVTTASFNVLVTADVMVPLNLDGAASNVSITQTGQTARLTFNATAGQNVGLSISGLTVTPSSANFVLIYILKPDGSLAYSGYPLDCFVSTPGCALNFPALPVSGTYTVLVVPNQGSASNFIATLSTDVNGGALTLNTPYSLSIPRLGQNAWFTFSGTAGQHATLTLSTIATTPSGKTVIFAVYRADTGARVAITSTAGTSVSLPITSLPVTGTYNVFVDPTVNCTATMTVTLGP